MSPQVTLSGTFDTLLAAYTGTILRNLSLLASNDNCTTGGSPGTSCVTFNVTQGTVYRLQVDGAGGSKGNVAIAVAFVWTAPPNDAFSSALSTFPATGTTLGATLEAGEVLAGFAGTRCIGKSVWYKYTAPALASSSRTLVCFGVVAVPVA